MKSENFPSPTFSPLEKYLSNKNPLQLSSLLEVITYIPELRKHPDYRKKIIDEVKLKITVGCFEKLRNEEKKKILDFLIDTKEYHYFCKLLNVSEKELLLENGPLVKNESSFALEFILKMHLHRGVKYQTSPRKVIVKEHGQEKVFMLDEILKHANFDHIDLDEFSQYSYLEKTGNLDFLGSASLQNFFYNSIFQKLTLPECFAIYQYTYSEHKLWNDILRGNSFVKSLNDLVGIAIAISGLRKLEVNASENPEIIVRFEKEVKNNLDSYKKFENDFLKRKQFHRENLLYRSEAFSSFSSNPTLLDHFREVNSPYLAGATLVMSAPYESINPCSHYEEDEVLFSPGRLAITFFASINMDSSDEYFYSIVQFVQSLSGLEEEKRKLGEEIRPILYSFNDIHWALYNQKKMLNEFLKTVDSFLEDKDVLDAIVYVENILNTPYTNPNDLHVNSSWVLETAYGKIFRPNHGLSHTLTVAFFVPWIVYVLKSFAKNTHSYKAFDQKHIKILQLCMLFSVVGRENDVGWVENERLYKSFRQKSGELFEKYCLEHCMHLFESADEIALYKKHLIDMGNPDNHDPIHVIINMSHKLQLLRCFEKFDLNTSIISYFKSEMVSEASEVINALVLLSVSCIRLTGDQILFVNWSYSTERFYKCNHDKFECWKRLSSVTGCAVDILSYAIINAKLKSLDHVNLNKKLEQINLKNLTKIGIPGTENTFEDKLAPSITIGHYPDMTMLTKILKGHAEPYQPYNSTGVPFGLFYPNKKAFKFSIDNITNHVQKTSQGNGMDYKK